MSDIVTIYLPVSGTVSTSVASLSGRLTLPTDMPYYSGVYEVNPDFVGTILSTAGTVLTQNVNVHPIQVEDVLNPSGGRTVYIGGFN